MQMCPNCDKVYDESEYTHCPYCSGELDDSLDDEEWEACPVCRGVMYWDDYDGCWVCSNCEHTESD